MRYGVPEAVRVDSVRAESSLRKDRRASLKGGGQKAGLSKAGVAGIREAVEGLDRAGEWQPPMGPIIEPILKAADEASSFEEFREKLREVLPELNDREPSKRLERNGFTAHLSGDAGLD